MTPSSDEAGLPSRGLGRSEAFDPIRFYAEYSSTVLARPGYPARAVFKSWLAFRIFGRRLFGDAGRIRRYADIGGCFGFGANAMASFIAEQQGEAPKTSVFELGSGFVKLGSEMFPAIEFIRGDFAEGDAGAGVFDLVTLFDVVEHVPEAGRLLRRVAEASRYAILKTPLETGGEWRGGKPFFEAGASHPDGHVHFFTPAALEHLLESNGLEILERRVVQTIVPAGSDGILLPEGTGSPVRLGAGTRTATTFRERVAGMILRYLPFGLTRGYFGGGEHLCLCRSRVV